MKITEIFNKTKPQTVAAVKLMTEQGEGFYSFDGRLYHSDIVRAAIRPRVKAIGKLTPKHVREYIDKDGKTVIEVNREPYLRFLLEEPNPYMTWQVYDEKMETQLALNNNAFALIVRDEAGLPRQLLPLNAVGVDAILPEDGELLLRFTLANSRVYTFRYTDVIHLRDDFNDNDFFGTSKAPALAQLMEIVTTTDQGIVKAVRNSAVIRWLLRFSSAMRPEDLEAQVKNFAEQFLSTKNGTGVAGVDAKGTAEQVKPTDYVPNAAQLDRTTKRIMNLFGTNEKIVDRSCTEDQWGSYFDLEVSAFVKQRNGEYTRKLLTRRQRAAGNRIDFEASIWDCASLKTKLSLVDMVDRRSLSPNEWRRALTLAPVEGGDEMLLRLDTAREGSKAEEEP